MPTIVVGKNSFLAQGLENNAACKDWIFLSHREALVYSGLSTNDNVLVNFAFDPALMTEKYSEDRDIDLKLARMIQSSDSRYIMLSSRMVYGQQDDIKLTETQSPEPQNVYGKAKLHTEQALQNMVMDRLTILRLSNIFGMELGRKTFFGHALTSLKTKGQIALDIAPDSVRDFFAKEHFQSALIKIAATPKAGIYNLGSGYGTPAHNIAQWLIDGYGSGEITSTGNSMAGQFYLNMDKTRSAFDLPVVQTGILQSDCVGIGQLLRACQL